VGVVDWSKLPDLIAVALLACAFASVVRSSHASPSKLWLTGWILIAVHSVGLMVTGAPGIWGTLGALVSLVSLLWAGLLFMWASVPHRGDVSSRWMHRTLLGVNGLYIVILTGPTPAWMVTLAAVLLGVAPLAVALMFPSKFRTPPRWMTVLLYGALSVFVLLTQHRPGNGVILAINAVFATVFLGCGILFWNAFRHATAGALITISGFFTWAAVFMLSPLMSMFYPQVRLESEVWNLPKYVVAVGMILLLLEDQIEHNKFLALHDELTGLPNRRLFQDRLASVLERARRMGTQAGLLSIDLNGFKQVNDTLGHHPGDLLLQRVAAAFAGRVRRSDTVARTGGDEFSVVLEEPTSYADAEIVVQSLMQLLAEPIEIENNSVRIGASVGIAIFPDDAMDMESLCIVADRRMYSNKTGSADGGRQSAFARSARHPEIAPSRKDGLHLSQNEPGP
jgi:diguanylate cyclase (GGDEF)-like protein